MNEVLRRGRSTGFATPGTDSIDSSELAQLRAAHEGLRERPIVLVVEDDPDDRDFIAWAFTECESPVELRWAEDGEQALVALSACRATIEEPRPNRPALILLDLEMPGLGGRETLAAIRRDLSLRTIPVIVFTGSGDGLDITRCYELGANSYFTKPNSMEGYRNIIRILETYWLRKAELPPRD